MRKMFLLTAFAAATMIASIVSANAQTAGLPRTVANHSVSVDLLGLHYAYELPIGRTATIIGRAGLNFGGAWDGKSGGDWCTGAAVPWAWGSPYFMAVPTVEIEPRWYYGLDRRAGHARGTEGNQGSFLSLKVAGTFPAYTTDGRKITSTTTFSPTWGLRRVWCEHWMFEFTTGVRVGFYNRRGFDWWGDEDDLLEHLDVSLRFGYKF